ncbi:MAG TPA: type I DNA topoisomerase, partial [Spirochaetota bacterium]
DREGEAISWHLSNVLSLKNKNIKRIEFNEITEHAIKDAVKHPRDINIDLVNAQQARRILDRIVGYNISPILWKKVKKGLSAGRVQSVALKVICDREAEIDSFKPQEYWTLEIEFLSKGKKYRATLHSKNGEKIEIHSKEEMDRIIAEIGASNFEVLSIQKKERKRNPQAPYITSKLQQDAANRLGYTSSKTMMVAQQLYEGVSVTGEGPVGLITYMRTDSTRIAEYALASVRGYISSNYSEDYLPPKANFYQNKKGAQDAHEAIRPTDVNRSPSKIKDDLTRDQFKLYELIWNRFVASQMTPERSEIHTMAIRSGEYEFRASASRTVFDGFTVVDNDEKQKKNTIPDIKEGSSIDVSDYLPEQHFTTPPARYNDASLVKFLEESGIGRPSTYAPTINTLIKRYYVTRSGRQLVPTVLGKLVNRLVSENFPTLVSADFTAKMEDQLDGVEFARLEWVGMLREFYQPFHLTVEKAIETIEEMKGVLDEDTDLVCEKCGMPMKKKLGKFGFFLACSGFPACRNSKPLPLGKCPKDGCDGDVIKRSSKKGRAFYSCSRYPDCDFITREIPSDKHCPTCGKLLFTRRIKGKGQKLICLNEKCGYSVDLLDEESAAEN